MTSSLVGSEMCIRDSPWGVAGKLPACSLLLCRVKPGPLGLPSQGSATVSYTHLTLPTICSV
eukprot:6404868-Prorocentrum_lima.AAC.1